VSLLVRTCPKCKGKRRLPNWILPGTHACGRCGGTGETLTLAGRMLARAITRDSESED